MPPYRGLNRAELLGGIERMFYDTRPIANRNTSMRDMLNDDYQIQQGVMAFGPGSWIPFRNPGIPEKGDISRLRRLEEYVNKIVESLDKKDWNAIRNIGETMFTKPHSPPTPRLARLNEVQGLVEELSRRYGPYIQSIMRQRSKYLK